MTVRLDPAGTIRLEGSCPVDDAEPLLRLLQDHPGAALDWADAVSLHTAVLQIILAARPNLIGGCGDPLVSRWVTSAVTMQ